MSNDEHPSIATKHSLPVIGHSIIRHSLVAVPATAKQVSSFVISSLHF
jgi:hypothetical protein